MGLEECDHTARATFQRTKRSCAFLGIMAEIVDHGDAGRAGTDDVEPPSQTFEIRQRPYSFFHADSRRVCAGNGGECIGQIVPPRHREIERIAYIRLAIVDEGGDARFTLGNAVRLNADMGVRCVYPEPDRGGREPDQRSGLRIVEIDDGAGAGGKIAAEQYPQFFHALVIEADIQQDADRWAIQGDRTVAFVHFGHESVALADAGAGEGHSRGDEVLHHRAIHDRGIAPVRGQNPAQHRGDGRFAAGAGNRDALRCQIEQRREKLRTRHSAASEFGGADHFGHGIFYRGRRDDHLIRRRHSAAILCEQADALLFKPHKLVGRAALIAAAIRSGDCRALAMQDHRQREHTRSADAAEKPGMRCEVLRHETLLESSRGRKRHTRRIRLAARGSRLRGDSQFVKRVLGIRNDPHCDLRPVFPHHPAGCCSRRSGRGAFLGPGAGVSRAMLCRGRALCRP